MVTRVTRVSCTRAEAVSITTATRPWLPARSAATTSRTTEAASLPKGAAGSTTAARGSKTLTLNDTIVAGNTTTTSSGTSPSDISAEYSAIIRGTAIVAGSNNLLGTYYLNGTAQTGTVVGSNNINLYSTDPPPALDLGPLGDYGGPTETMPLLPGSLAIGNGSQALELDANGSPLAGDQRGFGFDSPNPDIGAYQDVQFPLVVSVATDGVGTPPGELDLRAAVNLDDLQASATAITFDATAFGTTQTITLVDGQLELSNTTGTITITGPTAGVTVSGGQLSRVFQVDKSVTATISGLTIADGLTSTATGGSYAGSGGGLLNLGTATLIGCTVTGNTAESFGGGVSDNDGTIDLTGCTISANTAANGAGLFIDGNGAPVACGPWSAIPPAVTSTTKKRSRSQIARSPIARALGF